ncbi:MAG: nucleoside hydrolase [Planctomycetaceae bacterium]|jgi:inosine-uridine nucleoside N-ribohydrolase|nr:nucleoside hydrolase [Planctomycetaceae bacterium]MBP64005.1 nucleoside hydrolase [Planctomycetaceae bacterium]
MTELSSRQRPDVSLTTVAETLKCGKIPVILDTDVGDDIDDMWALGLLLKCPELDVRLVVGDQGKPDYRARLLAKFLQTAGRTDVDVGMGLDVGQSDEQPLAAWIADYRLDEYPGNVHEDGVQAIVETIMQSTEPVTLIAIGPLPNVAAALERQPAIAQRARFVGMHGSVRFGYDGSEKPSAEYNVSSDTVSCRQVLNAAWDAVIAPLDTSGSVHLSGWKYRQVRDADNPIARALIENYRLWTASQSKPGEKDPAESRSSTLYDTVAIYLAFADSLLKIEELGIRVTDDGHTLIDSTVRKIAVATGWRDLSSFEDFLVDRLAGK